MSALLDDAVYRSASFFRRSPLALGRWLPTFRAMAVSSVLKNSHSRMPAHVGAGVPANRNVHRGLSRSTYDSHRGEYYVDELLATQTSASNNDISGYTLCANEWESFALPSTCDVAYGAKGSFAFRSAQSGTITFNNATFGDPAPGAPKKGYYRLSGGQRFYAHANHLYSVAALTNQAGGVVERYRYDTFGNRTTLAPDGITTRAVSSYNQQVGFTGRYLDRETGLWYYRTRMYSGVLGRFIDRMPWWTIGPVTIGNYAFSEVDSQTKRQIVKCLKLTYGAYSQGRYNLYDAMNGAPSNYVEPYSWPLVIVALLFFPNWGEAPEGPNDYPGPPGTPGDVINVISGPGKAVVGTGVAAGKYLANKCFKRWFHKKYKKDQKMPKGEKNNPNLPDEEVEDAWREWNENGQPNAD
jgi:RHS repeat-associated protein